MEQLEGLGNAYAQMQIREILETMHVPVLPFQKVLISQVHEKIDAVLTEERTKTLPSELFTPIYKLDRSQSCSRLIERGQYF
ncbi:NADPH-dependent FMN reductase domain containing protein [Bacillus atrophaeus UCMB-5137]|nr:NADPH-dependent FMN reductase domain containing protein [Bacillus atrophaeus UCMB-5137]